MKPVSHGQNLSIKSLKCRPTIRVSPRQLASTCIIMGERCSHVTSGAKSLRRVDFLPLNASADVWRIHLCRKTKRGPKNSNGKLLSRWYFCSCDVLESAETTIPMKSAITLGAVPCMLECRCAFLLKQT